jgi:exonuclease III
MQNQKKQYDDDDGRTIVSMDVDGTPWHDRNVNFAERQAQDLGRRQKVAMYGERMTGSEARRYTFYAMLAGLALQQTGYRLDFACFVYDTSLV